MAAQKNQPARTNDIVAQVASRINDSDNVLVTLSKNPSVDELSAALAFTYLLDKIGKHVTAIFSGDIPNAIEFLEPEKTFEVNTDSLRDFIIALDKDKADHLRYKVDGDFVKVFITPYKTLISQDDMQFSYGDYNVDLVIALNVRDAKDLDGALTEYGRIMHDATSINISASTPGEFADLEWGNPNASSVCEMIFSLLPGLHSAQDAMDKTVATAFLTGIISSTNRFSNERTTPATFEAASKLMASGADQRLISLNVPVDILTSELKNDEASDEEPAENKDEAPEKEEKDGNLNLHKENKKSEKDSEIAAEAERIAKETIRKKQEEEEAKKEAERKAAEEKEAQERAVKEAQEKIRREIENKVARETAAAKVEAKEEAPAEPEVTEEPQAEDEAEKISEESSSETVAEESVEAAPAEEENEVKLAGEKTIMPDSNIEIEHTVAPVEEEPEAPAMQMVSSEGIPSVTEIEAEQAAAAAEQAAAQAVEEAPVAIAPEMPAVDDTLAPAELSAPEIPAEAAPMSAPVLEPPVEIPAEPAPTPEAIAEVQTIEPQEAAVESAPVEEPLPMPSESSILPPPPAPFDTLAAPATPDALNPIQNAIPEPVAPSFDALAAQPAAEPVSEPEFDAALADPISVAEAPVESAKDVVSSLQASNPIMATEADAALQAAEPVLPQPVVMPEPVAQPAPAPAPVATEPEAFDPGAFQIPTLSQ